MRTLLELKNVQQIKDARLEGFSYILLNLLIISLILKDLTIAINKLNLEFASFQDHLVRKYRKLKNLIPFQYQRHHIPDLTVSFG